MTAKPTIRCAVYTRKSTEEGLDQEFNSLDAQYESCAAYIASQRHEGWKLVPEHFDDGGISGGTLERPGLQRLMAEINAGRIGMVVVYKIDRLTRSLADFVRLVERLDARGCSFVSVTQAFNTSTSMGRLTLNVLLSFAQFEREVTAERIRDKISASKKKGMWMGGTIPLGYDRHSDPQRRELVVHAAEAEVVRTLFRLYDETPNLRSVEAGAARLELRPKLGKSDSPGQSASRVFSRGHLHYLLTNPVYIGRIRHKELSYPGLHPAIIDQALWDRVQAKLLSARARPRGRGTSIEPARCLMGKIRDETGDLLTPTHTVRRGIRYTYYVSNRLIENGVDPSGWRIPAPAFEQTLSSVILSQLRHAAQNYLIQTEPDALASGELIGKIVHLCQRITQETGFFAGLVDDVALRKDRLSVRLNRKALAECLAIAPDSLAPDFLAFDHPMTLRRRGVELRIIAGDRKPEPDPVLIRVLAEARAWAKALRSGTSLAALVASTGRSAPYIRVRLPLAFLSPNLQASILDGHQRPDLSVARLISTEVPLDWTEQERRFG